MTLPFSLFLALRYLKPKRTFLSTITLLSVLGVTLGITVLIVVISVMTGFDRELRNKVLGFDAHLLVTNRMIIDNWREIGELIKKTEGVVAWAPFVQGPVLIEMRDISGARVSPAKMRGIDPDMEKLVTDIASYIVEGEFNLDGDYAILGRALAQSLGVGVGDEISVISPTNVGDVLAQLRKIEENPNDKGLLDELKEFVIPASLTVSGIFETGRFQYDSEFFIVPLYIGQELYVLEDGVQGITVRTSDPYLAPTIRDRMEETFLRPPLFAETWIDLNSQLFDAIRLERNVMFIILMIIIIVAAFSIANTMITVTVQKTREIGIMKAMGADKWKIVWVFLAQGMIVGFFGNLTGVALGMTLVTYRNEFKELLARTLGIEIFPADVYQFSQIPAEVIPGDVAKICISAFVICSLAALIPAYFAARLDPVKALRQEG